MDTYVKLAKEAIENFILEQREMAVPQWLPSELIKKRAGVFVTIFKDSDLRGCIGTYMPCQQNIALEIIKNAIAACSSDHRFSLVLSEELPSLRYEVSVLSKPWIIRKIDELDPRENGVIVKSEDGRCGLLLPGIPGVKTVKEQIAIACTKGGINFSRDRISIYTFTIEKHV